jgi:hypothetical protein
MVTCDNGIGVGCLAPIGGGLPVYDLLVIAAVTVVVGLAWS